MMEQMRIFHVQQFRLAIMYSFSRRWLALDDGMTPAFLTYTKPKQGAPDVFFLPLKTKSPRNTWTTLFVAELWILSCKIMLVNATLHPGFKNERLHNGPIISVSRIQIWCFHLLEWYYRSHNLTLVPTSNRVIIISNTWCWPSFILDLRSFRASTVGTEPVPGRGRGGLDSTLLRSS